MAHSESQRTDLWSYFTRTEWVVFLCILGTGVLLRWLGIDDRPLHHDESIHVMFGRYFFDFPDIQYYKYNPEYHGPLLYTLLRFTYAIFGDSEFSARVLINIFGTSFLIVPLLFRQHLAKLSVIGITLFLALSPMMIFWSRFVREDIFVVTGMVLMVVSVVLVPARLKALVLLIGVVLQWTSKENIFVTLALVWGYLVFEYLFRWIVLREFRDPFPVSFLSIPVFAVGTFLQFFLGMSNMMDVGALLAFLCLFVDVMSRGTDREASTLIGALLLHVRTYRREVLVSFLVAAGLFCYLYGGGFRQGFGLRHPDGILDGLYQLGISFWAEKHHIERIKGPFLFHVFQLTWYELMLMSVWVFHLSLLFRRSGSWERLVEIGILSLAVACTVFYLFFPAAEDQYGFWNLFKVKSAVDVGGVVIVLTYPLLLTIHHLWRREGALALWGYLFSASLFTYSYLGEKVPWLAQYPQIAAYVYFALFLQKCAQDGDSLLSDRMRWATLFLWVGYGLITAGLVFSFEASDFAQNVHLLVSGLLLVGLGFLQTRVLDYGSFRVPLVFFGFVFLFNLRSSIMTNFDLSHHEFGYISQVHTTVEVVNIAKRVRHEIETAAGASKPTVLVSGDAVWPLTWYLRDLPEYKFSATDQEKAQFTYIFQDFKEDGSGIPPGFSALKVPLRGWWVPDFKTATVRDFFAHSFTLYPWSPLGFTYVHFLTRTASVR